MSAFSPKYPLKIVLALLFIGGSLVFAEAPTPPPSQITPQSVPENKATPAAISPQAVPESNNGIAPALNNEPVKKSFGVGDINLHQGTLNFDRTDLVIPGKGGLGVVINRRYDSSKYREKTGGYNFGFGMGRGWSLSVGMKAYVAMRRTVNSRYDGIYIQSSQGVEVFRWDAAQNQFVNKSPNNKAKVKFIFDNQINPSPVSIGQDTYDRGRIEMRTEDGRLYVFSLMTIVEQPRKNGGNYELLNFGYELTRIEDVNGNTVRYQYDHLEGDDWIGFTPTGSDFNFMVPGVLGEAYKRWMDEVDGRDYNNQTLRHRYRLRKIIDTWGNEVGLNYIINQDSADENRFRVNQITYKNHEGVLKAINYTYDTLGSLIKVSVDGLPDEVYTYDTYSPKYIWRAAGHYSGPFRDFNRDYVYIAYPDYSVSAEHTDDMGIGSEMNGQVLTSVQSRQGGVLTYKYEDCLVKDGVSGDQVKTDILLEGLSAPVVISKTLKEDASLSWEYKLQYPRDAKGHLNKTRYPVLNETKDSFGFAEVTIDNPPVMVDESYQFERGFLKSMKKGIQETQMVYDFTRNLKTKETQIVAGSQRSETSYAYDTDNNIIQTDTKKGTTPTLRTQSEYSQNAAHKTLNLIHLSVVQKVTDLITNETRQSRTDYTPLGQVSASYDGENRKTKSVTYDNEGRPITVTDHGPSAVTTTIGYIQSNNTNKITKTSNGKFELQEFETFTGNLLKNTDINGNVTRYGYDSLGRAISVTYPDNTVETVSYSADLKQKTMTSMGKTVTITLDTLDRPILINNAEGELDIKTEYYFGSLPKAVYQNKGTGWDKKKEFTYDQYLRKISTTTDFGTSSTQYNDSAMTIKTIDPIGRQQEVKQDEWGRTLEAKNLANNSITKYELNSFGELLVLTDPKGIRHKTTYDNMGRPKEISHPSLPNESFQKNIGTTYENGAPKTTSYFNTKNQLFRTYSTVYDSQNRPKQAQLNGTTIATNEYEESNHGYSKGQLTSIENESSKLDYSYDIFGRTIETKTTIKALDKQLSIKTSYNPINGQIEDTSYPDNKKIRYTYNSLNRLEETNYNNNQAKIQYTYNTNGTVRTMTYGNGTTITYTYEKEVLLTKLSAKNRNDITLYEQNQTYDQIGRITKIVHNDYIHYGKNLTREYTYTTNNELETVKINGELKYRHNYDKGGNHLRFETLRNNTLGKDNMVIEDPKNQLKQKNHKDGKQIRLAYDDMGNLTQKDRYWDQNTKADTMKYTYTTDDQISTISDDDRTLMQAQYDPQRQRIMTKMPGNDLGSGTKWYYWANGQILGEGHEKWGDYTVRYIYSGNQKVAMIRPKDLENRSQGENTYYFINNPQGTPVLIIDENGEPVSRINMDEWGNLGPMTQGSKSEINYTGKKMDQNTGLFYFNQRYYDPELGRFISQDPAQQGLNPYAYCGNNPMMYVDPDGQLFGIDDWIIGAAIGAIIAGWGKDLTKPQTWGDMVLGAVIGAVAVAGAEYVWSEMDVKAEFGIPVAGGGVVYVGGQLNGQKSGPNEDSLSEDLRKTAMATSPSIFTNEQDYFFAENSLADQHDLANRILSLINPVSVLASREYGGMIYKRENGKYGFTGPIKGDLDGVNPQGPRSVPSGTLAVAYYHTHGANTPGYDNEHFSSEDKGYARHFNIGGYLGTPAGYFRYYSSKTDNVYELGRIPK